MSGMLASSQGERTNTNTTSPRYERFKKQVTLGCGYFNHPTFHFENIFCSAAVTIIFQWNT
jgi:hypothetical protein